MLGIVVSDADEASRHIGEQLHDLAEWSPVAADTNRLWQTDGAQLRRIDELHLDTTDVADRFDGPDAILFVSRHAGETGPLLTAHFTGNYGEAKYGGESEELAPAATGLLAPALRQLKSRAPSGYDVSMECTHHGPTAVGAPSLFLELGSGPEQWADLAAARAVAQVALDLRHRTVQPSRTVVAFGGGHYAPRTTRIARETDWAVGHVCADWALDAIDDPGRKRDLIGQTFDRSAATFAILDGERPELAAIIQESEDRLVSETWVQETSGIPLPVVDHVEDRLGSISAGVRFGDRASATEHPHSIGIVDVPQGPLEAAEAIDRERTREAIANVAVAFETRENGSRVGERVAVRPDTDRSEIVDALVSVLDSEYEVQRSDRTLTLKRREFDPDLARDAGVPEGPAFGRLANGETIHISGEEIRPDDVTRIRRTEFRL